MLHSDGARHTALHRSRRGIEREDGASFPPSHLDQREAGSQVVLSGCSLQSIRVVVDETRYRPYRDREACVDRLQPAAAAFPCLFELVIRARRAVQLDKRYDP